MYTHTFQVQVNGVDVEGEISFNSGQPPKLKFNSGFEMKTEELDSFNEFLKELQKICKHCGEIQHIEISKK